MTDRELLKQALEALEIEKRTYHEGRIPRTTVNAITAIRAHLDNTEDVEPVAWMYTRYNDNTLYVSVDRWSNDQNLHDETPLYLSPTIPPGYVLEPEEQGIPYRATIVFDHKTVEVSGFIPLKGE